MAPAPGIVDLPPHRLPELLCEVRVLPRHYRRKVALDQGVERRGARIHGIGVSRALGAIGVSNPHCDEFEMGDQSVRAVAKATLRNN